jgi:hypothetical protein
MENLLPSTQKALASLEKLKGFIDADNLPIHQQWDVQELMAGIKADIECLNLLCQEEKKEDPKVVSVRRAIIVQCFRMRRLQKDYYKHKSPSVLVESKNVEARVDRLLLELEQLTGIKLATLLEKYP